jgi:plastocyanin
VSPTNPSLTDGDTLQMSATPRDQNGAAMNGLPPATFSLQSGTAVTVTPAGLVIAQAAGNSSIRASLTSGGTTHSATTNASVTALLTTANVTASGAGTSFSPASVKIATNGTVMWQFPGPNGHNVTFQNPPAPVQNIDTRSTGSEGRTFATAGRYQYECTVHPGMSGEVIVRNP